MCRLHLRVQCVEMPAISGITLRLDDQLCALFQVVLVKRSFHQIDDPWEQRLKLRKFAGFGISGV